MSYYHLNADDRLKLESWRVDGISHGEIARRLGCHCSTIGRELTRNGDSYSGWYRAKTAEKTCRKRRSTANKIVHQKMVTDSTLVHFVEAKLRLHWSPEQIAGRLKRVNKETKDRRRPTISHERIYQWVYHERKDLIDPRGTQEPSRLGRQSGTSDGTHCAFYENSFPRSLPSKM